MNIYTLFGMLFAGLALGLFIAGSRSVKPHIEFLPTTDLAPKNGTITQISVKYEPVSPVELFKNPNKYIGKNIEIIDYMSTDSNWYSPPEFMSGLWLKNGKNNTTIEHLKKGFQKVKMQGEFVDPGPTAGSKYAIELTKFEILPMDKNYIDITKTEMDEILTNKDTRMDRKWVRYEGTWTSGFEKSYLDDKIWMSSSLLTDSEMISDIQKKLGENKTQKVRVTGLMYNNETQNYGHLGGGKAEIIADSIEFMD